MCKLSQPPQRARRSCVRKQACSAAEILMTIREGTAGTANNSSEVALSGLAKPIQLCHDSRVHCPILYVERFSWARSAMRTGHPFASRYQVGESVLTDPTVRPATATLREPACRGRPQRIADAARLRGRLEHRQARRGHHHAPGHRRAGPGAEERNSLPVRSPGRAAEGRPLGPRRRMPTRRHSGRRCWRMRSTMPTLPS